MSAVATGLALLVVAVGVPTSAPGPDTPAARFALILGVNQPADPQLPALHYADDDAADYQDLFRMLGARTYLLTRLDENTRRLHPQAAAEARDPVHRELTAAVGVLTEDVARARAAGVPTVLYVIYAGHGGVDGEEGYVSLEDGQLTGAALANEVLGPIGADQVHLIVDACYSYFVAFGRGPGGERRPLHHFTEAPALLADPRWGLLLSTSSARESHEWEAFQAGVFSHEVRSGLYGAADANGDGWVSYPEMVGFIDRANAAIPNEKFRPDVFARPPRGTDRLADLRTAEARHIDIGGEHAAHYLLEDGRGVRLADFHNAPGENLRLLHPAGVGPLYLRRLDTDIEYALAASPDVVTLANLEPSTPRTHQRGAAHDAFDLLFSTPFSQADVHPLATEPAGELTVTTKPPSGHPGLRWVGWLSLVGGLVSGAGSGLSAVEARHLAGGLESQAAEATASSRNSQIRTANAATGVLGGVAAAAVVSGIALLVASGTGP